MLNDLQNLLPAGDPLQRRLQCLLQTAVLRCEPFLAVYVKQTITAHAALSCRDCWRRFGLEKKNFDGILSENKSALLKTDYGQQEAIAVFGSDPRIYQTTVKEFYKDEAGQVCGALIAKLESKVVDEATGRRAMVPTGEEFAIECDLVLIAAGFTGCQPYVAEAFGVDLTKRGTVADTKYATNVPHVFTCGDMRRGQSLVVWALREGRDAAAEVDKSLMGYTNL